MGVLCTLIHLEEEHWQVHLHLLHLHLRVLLADPPVAARAEIVRTPIVKHIGKAEIVVEFIGVKYVYDSLEDDLREHFDARQGPEWNILLMRRGQDTADGDVAYHIVYRETSL